MATLDDFFNAIAGQESSGNYGAVNRDTGALGKYQILPGNVGPWAKKYLGINVSTSQFLNNPALQDRLAKAVLGDYVKRYGYRGAASAWYSGNPNLHNNTRSQNGYPSIKSYVDGIMNRMGQSNFTGAMAAAGALGGIVGAVNKVAEKVAQTGQHTSDVYRVNENNVFTPGEGLGLATAASEAAAKAKAMEGQQPSATKGLGLDSTQGVGAGQVGLTTGFGVDDQSYNGGLGISLGTGSNSLGSTVNASAGAGSAQPGTSEDFQLAQQQKVNVTGGSPIRTAALELAQKYLGVNYVYGGGRGSSEAAFNGVDCSSLIWQALRQVGVNLPSTGRAQVASGRQVSIDKLKPGDIVAWNGGNHVALYLGNNQIIEAARPGTKVSVRSLGSSWDKANNMIGVSLDGLYG